MGNLSFEPEGGDGRYADWLVIPFEAAVQVAACSIVGHSGHSGARVSANPESRDSPNVQLHI
jgi:hypothetical protein